jgi:hypothetical protein
LLSSILVIILRVYLPIATAVSDIENKIRVTLPVDVTITGASEWRCNRRRQRLSAAPEVSVFEQWIGRISSKGNRNQLVDHFDRFYLMRRSRADFIKIPIIES